MQINDFNTKITEKKETLNEYQLKQLKRKEEMELQEKQKAEQIFFEKLEKERIEAAIEKIVKEGIEKNPNMSERQLVQLNRLASTEVMEKRRAEQLLLELLEKERMEAAVEKIVQDEIEKNPSMSERSIKFAKQNAIMQIQEMRKEYTQANVHSSFQCN
jgi:predicted SnoaL-like aldol condensation-catalyzing enzyme